MTLRSMDLLPSLQELPVKDSHGCMSFSDMIAGLKSTNRAMDASEFASAVSLNMRAVFDSVNVDDRLTTAYEAQYPGLASDHSMHEHWQEMLERGPESVQGFISGLKGKVAELHAKDMLEARGYGNVRLASSSNQEGLDITALAPGGQYVSIQIKSGTSLSVSDLQRLIEEAPADRHFALGTELYDKVVASGMETGDEVIVDIGSDYVRVEGIEDGLDTLSGNLGIDVPDGVVDIIPYAAAIAGGMRLIYSAINTEMEFKAADRTTKNRIQVVQTLTLMSRMGISTVLATVGGIAGAAAGTPMPGLGNVIVGTSGSAIGAGVGMYLNKRLQPHLLDLALSITGLTKDDIFYYKNKPRIDALALRFQANSRELAALPRL